TIPTGEMPLPIKAFMNRIMAPARKAAMEPTERSMPPAMITNVAPTAMIPINAERVSTLNRFVEVRKDGWMSEPTTTSNARPTSGVSCCHGTRPMRSRQVGLAGTSDTDMPARILRSRSPVMAAQTCGVSHDRLFVQVVAGQRPGDHTVVHDDDPMGQAEDLGQLA